MNDLKLAIRILEYMTELCMINCTAISDMISPGDIELSNRLTQLVLDIHTENTIIFMFLIELLKNGKK